MSKLLQGNPENKIDEEYEPELNVFRDNLNKMIDLHQEPLQEIITLVNQYSKLEFSYHSNKNFKGHYGDIITKFNSTNKSMELNFRELNENLRSITNGKLDLHFQGSYSGIMSDMKGSIISTKDIFSRIIADINHMQKEHNNGDMDVNSPVSVRVC